MSAAEASETPQTRPARRVFRDALGWFVVTAGVLGLLAALGLAGGAADPANYLAGVWSRSFDNLYQAGLLAASLSLPAHLAWTLYTGGSALAPAYDAFAAWGQAALTSLGFLGTVVGISLAVGGLDEAMADQDPAALIAGLSTAFDTTFLGLAGALFLMLARVIVAADPE